MDSPKDSTSESTDSFHEAETFLNIFLPLGIKKIFILNGFDSPQIIGNINEDDIKSTEKFARITLPEIINEDEYSFYYGIFQKNVTSFKLLDGHKKKLKLIIEYYKMQKKKKENPLNNLMITRNITLKNKSHNRRLQENLKQIFHKLKKQ